MPTIEELRALELRRRRQVYWFARGRRRKSRKTVTFTPTNISGLVGWWDASDITQLYQDAAKTTPVTTDGDAIGAIADKSSQGNDATQATADNKAAYLTTGINGLSSADPDGTNDYYDLDSTITLSDFTIAWIGTFGNTGDGFFGDNANSWNELNALDTMRQRIANQSVLSLPLSTALSTVNELRQWTLQRTGSTVVLRSNGAVATTSPSYAYVSNAMDIKILMAARAALFNLSGLFGELLVYNRYLSGSELTDLEDYF